MKNNTLPFTLLLFLSLFFFNQCKQDKKESSLKVIDLETITETSKKASEIFEALEVFRLEFCDESALGEIRNVEFFENSIFVSDHKKLVLFEFDLNGNFVKSLNKFGKGPGEYSEICDFVVDFGKRVIELLDCQNNKILLYDIDSFEHIKSIELELQNSFAFVKENEEYIIQTKGFPNTIANKATNSPIILHKPNNKTYHPLFNIVKEPSSYFFSFEFNKVFSNGFDGSIYASFVFKDTIYRISESVAEPFLRIYAGNRGYHNDFINSDSHEKLEMINSQIHLFDDRIGAFFLHSLGNEDFLISYQEGFADVSSATRFFFHLNGGARSFAVNVLLNDFPPFNDLRMRYFRKSLPNQTLLYVLYPHDIEDRGLLNRLGLTGTENPLLLLFRLPKNES